METYSVRDLSFIYPGASVPAIRNISFSVLPGEFVTICGFSGCGKSTLLRQLKSSLRPFGKASGEVIFEGKKLNDVLPSVQAEKIGFVMQSPDNQSVCERVLQELAFGLESLGTDNSAMKRRIAETAAFFGINDILEKQISKLSGGQRQLVNLAAVMVLHPDVIILDEPFSQLDPVAAQELLNAVVRVNRELGTTVIICEHDLENILVNSTRLIVMDKGMIVIDDSPANAAPQMVRKCPAMISALPSPAYISTVAEPECLEPPLDIRSGKKKLIEICKKSSVNIPASIKTDTCVERGGVPLLELKAVRFRYEKNGSDILKGADLYLQRGEILSLMGGNGSGKTTLLQTAAGIRKPYLGNVIMNGKKRSSGLRTAYLPQNPKMLFLKETVRAELDEVCSEENNIIVIVRQFRLEGLLDRHPYDLSGGEQQRLALAKLLLTKPDVMLLDEPVKGLDSRSKNEVGALLHNICETGVGIILVSHDMDFCAEFSDRCAMLSGGEIVGTGTPHDFFSENRFFTTAAARLSAGIIDGAVTCGDILDAIGVTPPQIDNDNNTLSLPAKKNNDNIKSDTEISRNYKKADMGNRLISILSVLFLVPFTVFVGMYFLGDAKYLFISLLIMLECMLPFFARFEKRWIRTRELVIIAVMCALCICGRAVFYMLPEFKPVTALVIIAGTALGEESGFMIGAVSMLVSNIMFSQGPWTPWQMFSMGMIGFLSGLLFSTRKKLCSKLVLSIFGFLAAVIIYGGIMDPAAMLMSHVEPTAAHIAAYYIAGLPLDLVHGVSTAVFLWIGAEPIMKKLERVKKKYGLLYVVNQQNAGFM